MRISVGEMEDVALTGVVLVTTNCTPPFLVSCFFARKRPHAPNTTANYTAVQHGQLNPNDRPCTAATDADVLNNTRVQR